MCDHSFVVFLAGKLGNSAASATTTLGSKTSKRGMTSYPLPCDESVMSPKAHGTCLKPVQKPLRWQVDWDTADRICCFNRHYAEHSGYWEGICIPLFHIGQPFHPFHSFSALYLPYTRSSSRFLPFLSVTAVTSPTYLLSCRLTTLLYGLGIAAFKAETDKGEEITFYDSVTGKPLFIAPRGRTMEEFKKESRSHGWPSFRDEEVMSC